MKQIFLLVLILSVFTVDLSAQYTIEGIVTDESSNPLGYVNVFLQETLEGASSDEGGRFRFTTSASGTVTLSAMMLGYETYNQSLQLPVSSAVIIKMSTANVALNEVEIVASSYQLKGNSQWKQMNAVDLVTTGGSAGDLYNSIATLPGTQVVGESGRLFIRGGESREAQTYIDDMHVLNPYTSNGDESEPVRGRYSPFMFEGMSFSLGGYDPEYSQGLSSVLPLHTKDESPISKYGVNVSSVGLAGGGTKAFNTGSASVNLDYQNLGPYYKIVPDHREWITPYQKVSGSTQLRYEPTAASIIKLYGGYDYTYLKQRMDQYAFRLKENNLYLNSTYRNKLPEGYNLFAGAAFSYRDQNIHGALVADDLFAIKEWEIHLKTKIQKRFSGLFKLQAGIESMIRFYDTHYQDGPLLQRDINHSINAAFATGSLYFSDRLNLSVSSRAEYTTVNKEWNYTPRAVLNYSIKDIHLSAIAGRYTQLTDNEYMIRNFLLPSENCWHYIVGAYHQKKNRVYRLEAYYKQYDKLTWEKDDKLTALGDGYSKGIDLFFNDAELIKNFEYRIAYSLNYSERKYRDYPVKDVPQYATRHNASLSLKYDLSAIKSIIGITNRFASGRPYHNPDKAGFMNSTTPHYNSLDISWTFLANKKLIIYGSASNILGRKNIYNYTSSGTPMTTASRHFFYIGVFITLGGNTAYDVSNF